MEEYTKIAAVDNQFEAQILEEVLKETGHSLFAQVVL